MAETSEQNGFETGRTRTSLWRLSVPLMALLMLAATMAASPSPVAAQTGGTCHSGITSSITADYTPRGEKFWVIRLRAYFNCRNAASINPHATSSVSISKSMNDVKTQQIPASGNLWMSKQIGYRKVYRKGSHQICGSYSAFAVASGEFITYWGAGPGHERRRCTNAWAY